MQGVIACTALSDVERPAADVCIEMRWPICVGIATGSRVSLSMTLAAQLTHSLPLLSVCLPHSLSHFCFCYHGRSPPPVWLNLDKSAFQEFNLSKWVNNIAIKNVYLINCFLEEGRYYFKWQVGIELHAGIMKSEQIK